MRYYDYDQTYPLRNRRIQDPGRMDELEAIEIPGLSPETELIARASYRLGHAEAVSQNMHQATRELEQRAEKAEEKLGSALSDRDDYRRRSNQYYEETVTLGTKVEKLEAKLKPKKKVIKKKAVQGGRTSRSRN